ncbi:MAG TPA: tRNA (adenine-N1)-methyltransferase [Actinopolymorphaceae bacterium]|jgi:tRNA (adenine57-N1/adenine58-N1)-methyltransferase
MSRADHSQLLGVGQLVQLSDAKGRKHTVTLETGKRFFTHKGAIAHDDLLGRTEGITVTTDKGTPYLVLRPLLSDFTLSMPRGAQVVYPKDAAAIVGMADIFPGARVLEAGAGSGALSCSLLRAIGPTGALYSFERRPEFADVARKNVRTFFGDPTLGEPVVDAADDNPASPWTLTIGDLSDTAAVVTALGEPDEPMIDRMILDMLAPWECLETATRLLVPGGIVCAYVATTTQLSRLTETLRTDGGFTEPVASELLIRTWHVEGLAVRPDHRMVGHTGFLLHSRRLAPGVSVLRRQRRPAPGAYGVDYTGPRPADAPIPE